MNKTNKKTGSSSRNQNSASSKKTSSNSTWILRDSTTGRFTSISEDKNSISEADKLTLRAWKKTFENNKKAA